MSFFFAFDFVLTGTFVSMLVGWTGGYILFQKKTISQERGTYQYLILYELIDGILIHFFGHVQQNILRI